MQQLLKTARLSFRIRYVLAPIEPHEIWEQCQHEYNFANWKTDQQQRYANQIQRCFDCWLERDDVIYAGHHSLHDLTMFISEEFTSHPFHIVPTTNVGRYQPEPDVVYLVSVPDNMDQHSRQSVRISGLSTKGLERAMKLRDFL